jgi:hypothetical protein
MYCAITGGLGKSTLAYKAYTEMKLMGVFADSKCLSFDLNPESDGSAVIGEVQRWLASQQRWLASQQGPVLLLLDDVQHQRQLDDILNDTNLDHRSFVLVTSRRRDLVAPSDLYEMPAMDSTDALELFRWHSQGASSSGVLNTSVLQVCSTV